MIRVVIPFHLQTLAGSGPEVTVDPPTVPTLHSVIDALEVRFPTLRGTIRDQRTLERRPFLRFFVCREDWSHQPPDTLLPDEVASGKEPVLIVGAIAGG